MKRVNRKNIILYVGIVLTAILVAVAILAPYIMPYDPT